jgi:hypothetical protein
MSEPLLARRGPRERVSCPRCGKSYLRPLGIARPHRDCPGSGLDELREALAIRRADLTLLLWWTKQKQANEAFGEELEQSEDATAL